jgi:hypothetical protein
MGTRNNPSPGGLRPGLENSTKRTRTRKQPTRASKMATVENASDSEGEVATMTEPRTQTQKPPFQFTFEPPSSAPRLQTEQALAQSVEAVESRPVAPLRSTRRHNTRSSSRSVSPSLLNSEHTGHTEDPKPKGKGAGRPRSTSASSTRQGIEATNARGGKRSRADSENGDVVDAQTTKRAKVNHTDPSDRPQPATRKRKNNLRNQVPGSPIPEVPEEEDASDNRSVKRNKLPQEELEFSYVHIINTYSPQPPRQPSHPAEEQTEEAISEHSSSRAPQLTSINQSTETHAPAQVESSQRSDAQSKPTEIAEQRAIHGTPTLSTPQQSVIERTDAQSSYRRPEPEGIDQQRSTLRNRFESTPPLPTLKNPHPTIRSTATSNGSPVLRQGLLDTRVVQGSARDGGAKIPSNPAEREAYLQKNYGKPRSRILHPGTKTVLVKNPIDIFEDSEHEEDETCYNDKEFKEWKEDLRVAKIAYEKVRSGERLPEAEPSGYGKQRRIVSTAIERSQHHPLTILQTRRKPGETPPASRPRRRIFIPDALYIPGSSTEEPILTTNVTVIDAARVINEWTQRNPTNILPSIQRFEEFLEASKSEGMARVRSAAPSPASQWANPQAPSNEMVRQRQDLPSPRDASNRSSSASPNPSDGEAAIHHSEMNETAEDHDSVALPDDDDQGNDTMSENTSEVDANEAIPTLPTTPIQTPPQQAPEPRAWSVFTTVKNAVSSPFKFLGAFTSKAGGAATTNGHETEFTFTHPHKPAQSFTTPTRSNRQRAKPQSERRGTVANQRRVSNSARVPQTERQLRHVDKSTPLHLRGAPSASDMQRLHDQQASTRQRQREAETASSDKNELSHGKTFRAPSPSSDSDDSEEDIDVDADADDDDDDDDEVISSGPKKDWAFLQRNKTNLQPPGEPVHITGMTPNMWKVVDKIAEEAGWVARENNQRSAPEPKSNLNSRRVHFQVDDENESTSNACDEPDICRTPSSSWSLPQNNSVFSLTREVKCNPDDPNDPYWMVRDPTMRTMKFRMVKAGDPDFRHLNMFGDEAWWFRLPPDWKNPETFTELTHGHEPDTRGRYKWQWDNYMENPENLAKEKALLLRRWDKIPEEKKQKLLPRIRPFFKNLMKIGEFAEDYDPSSTSAATSSGAGNPSGTFKAPSDSGSDDEDDEDDGDDDEDDEDDGDDAQVQSLGLRTIGIDADELQTNTTTVSEADSALKQKQWDQTPPPKPRPGNAQLPQPQPSPARTALATALASANKPRPLIHGPSNLRNVTQMSPLQQADQENRENADENGARGTTAKESATDLTGVKETINEAPAKETWVKEFDETKMTSEERRRQLQQVRDDIMSIPDSDLPVLKLPKAPLMNIQLPNGAGEYSGAMRDDVNEATLAAFEKILMGMKTNGGK